MAGFKTLRETLRILERDMFATRYPGLVTEASDVMVMPVSMAFAAADRMQ